MYRIRTVLAVAGAAAAAAALLPSAPAAADTVDRYAHAYFDGDGRMDVDVVRPAVGGATVDVEWQKSSCGLTDGLYVCDSTFRTAYDVPVTRFSFALTGADLTATVPYRELRRHCEVVVDTETETCTEEEAAGTTDLRVTWTASGEPRREKRVDEGGTTYVTTTVDTTVTGSGFGSAFDDPANSFGVLTRVRTIPPSA